MPHSPCYANKLILGLHTLVLVMMAGVASYNKAVRLLPQNSISDLFT